MQKIVTQGKLADQINKGAEILAKGRENSAKRNADISGAYGENTFQIQNGEAPYVSPDVGRELKIGTTLKAR